MPTIQVRVDVTDIPHTFIVITDDNGNQEGWGFAPKEAGEMFGEGNIYDDTNHPYDYSTTPQELTQQQYQDLKDFIQNSIENPPYYSVPGDWVPPENNNNCTTWVIDAFNSANIPDVFGVTNDFVWNPYGQSIFIILNKFFSSDQDPAAAFGIAKQQGSPIVIDLDGDGVETLSQQEGVYFDLDNNGMAEKTGWAGQDDGLLVLDRNNNGNIDSGSELFGNHTELNDGTLANNGYEALAELDDNADGVIDILDGAYSQLQVWQDKNGDGISTDDELVSLSDAGIISISSNYSDTSIDDGHGNTIKQSSTAILSDGSSVDTADVWFSVNKTQTVDRNQVELTEDILLLPDAVGFGNVRSLRQSMVDDQVLQDLVTQFTNLNTNTERLVLMDSIIYQWTGAQDVDPNSYDEYGSVYMDGRRVAALEQLVGTKYLNNINQNHVQGPQAASYLEAEYAKFSNYVYAQLMSQTAYQEFFTNISITYNSNTDGLELDLSSFVDSLKASIEIDEGSVIGALSALNGLSTYSSEFIAQVNLLKYDETLGIYILDNYYSGTAADDTLLGTSADDYFVGGMGNDTLYGGGGNDVYKYNIGAGSDVIFDEFGNDAISFGEGISQNSIQVSRDATRLFIDILDNQGNVTGDGLEIRNVFDFTSGEIKSSAIETFIFDDNSQLSLSQLIEQINSQGSTQNDDVIYGYESSEVLSGIGGNDSITAGAGNDIVNGGDGDDFLDGGLGNDILEGGTGSDILEGGEGNDTYNFNLGDGSDTIADTSGTDTISFGEGITLDNLHITRDLNNLYISILNENSQVTSDAIQINNIFKSDGQISSSAIESFSFTDGVTVSLELLLESSYTPDITDEDDYIFGTYNTNSIHGQAGNDYIYGQNGDDYLYGDEGNDRLYGENGNDILNGGAGNDFLSGGEGNDSLTGGEGNDELRGNDGDDTYFVSVGTGTTYIDNYDSDSSTDTLHFLQGIDVENVVVSRSGNDLVLILDSSNGQKVIVNNYFSGSKISEQYEHSIINSIHFYDGTVWTSDTVKSLILDSHDNYASIEGYYSDDTIVGNNNNNVIYGYAGNDTLNGNDGDDMLYAGEGDDILIGGNGNDLLHGGGGNDTYRIELGTGTTTIYNYKRYSNDVSTLEFLEGINPEDVEVSRVGSSDLQFTIQGKQVVHIENYFRGVGVESAAKNYLIETILFNDGTVWDLSIIIDKAISITEESDEVHGFMSDDNFDALGGDDTIYGYDGNDTLKGGEGDDALYGGNGDDHLTGGLGKDTLHGGNGADTLIGGAGADLLDGGSGSDLYIYQRGDGVDTIKSTSGDILRFGAGINPEDVTFYNDGNSQLVIIIDGQAQNQIQIIGEALAEVQFDNGDGIVWTNADIQNVIQVGSVNTAYGTTGDDEFTVDHSNDVIVEEEDSGTDTVYSSRNYTLSDNIENLTLTGLLNIDATGNELNNILIGNDGNNSFNGKGGSDIAYGGKGDDIYYNTTAVEYADEGIDTVINRNGGTLGDNIENLFLDDGSGIHSNFIVYAIGNDLDNILMSSAGGAHGDVLDGRSGADTMVALGLGSVVFYVDNVGDKVIRNGDDSSAYNDEVRTTISYTLPDFVEKLTLLGNDAIDGNGNNLDNLLDGSQNSNSNVLSGGWGNDTYILGAGDVAIESENQGIDKVIIKERVGSSRSYNLVGTNIENVSLEDSVYNYDVYGSDADNNIGGNQYDNQLYGGAGNDRLSGGAGEDHLYGGEGDDTLNGGDGSDIYYFSEGWGNDVIDVYGSTSIDVIKFNAGIEPSDITYSQDGNDLILSHQNGNDSIRIVSWYSSNPGNLYKIAFADGTTWQALENDLSEFNNLPFLTTPIDEQNTDEGQPFSFTLPANSFIDLDNDSITYSVTEGSWNSELPSWLSFDPDTLTFSGNPTSQDIAYLEINLFATDSRGGVTKTTFNLIVNNVNDAPTVEMAISDHIALAGEMINFTIPESTFNDIDYEDELTYSVTLDDGSDIPSWLLFDSETGSFSGTPSIEDKGSYIIAVTATDLAGASVTTTFSLSIDDVIWNPINGTENGEQLLGTNGTDLITAGAGDDELYGFSDNDRLIGGDGNDWLSGGNGSGSGSGDDELFGGEGNDTLFGEDGNDTMDGGNGDDHYYYYSGHGQDIISDAGDGQDILFFNNVSPERLSYHQVGNDLIVLVDGDLEQQVKVINHFLGGNYAIMVQPNGGYTQTPYDISNQLTDLPTGNQEEPEDPEDPEQPTTPTTSDIHLDFSGDDSLSGTTQNEVLASGEGDDALEGGQGNDYLMGGAGNDTYVINPGDGDDIIIDSDGNNIIHFSGGLTFNDVASGLMRSGDDLILNIATGNGSVRIQQFFSVTNTIEKMIFDTGSELTSSQVFSAFGETAPTTTLFSGELTLGDGQDNSLTGTVDNDVILGGKGDDSLTGSAGDDQLIGGDGDDTYIIGSGGGKDTIIDSMGVNTISFIDGIGFSDVSSGLMRSGDDLILSIASTGNQVKVNNFFAVANTINSLDFEDGSQITANQLYGAFGVSAPTDTDVIEDALSHVMTGTTSNDIITGTSANEYLSGLAGDDILSGGEGNDLIEGGDGNDRIKFGLNDGQDQIIQNDTNAAETYNDVIAFENDISYDELWFSRSDNDLQINVEGTDDQITISNWYDGTEHQLDQFESGSMVLMNNQIDQLVSAMAAYDVPMGAGNVIPQDVKDNLQPVLANSWTAN